MDNQMPFVTVVIPAHNEEEYLESCLRSLLTQDYPNEFYETIVVNNNSTDATVTIAGQLGIPVINEPNGPVGRVRNTGAKAARGELLLFLDGDCIAPKNWISYAVSRIGAKPELVLGGGYELREKPRPLEKYWLLEGTEGASLPKDLLGGCIAIAKSTFFKVGGFDEAITSGEDSKLSVSLRRSGAQVHIEREMSVIHLGNPTDLKTFFKRQIWHSENYINDFRSSAKDPTFYLTAAFIILTLTIPIFLLVSPSTLEWIFLLIILIPLAFSFKRIRRSGNPSHLKSIIYIYLLDFMYVLGRGFGLLKGLRNLIN